MEDMISPAGAGADASISQGGGIRPAIRRVESQRGREGVSRAKRNLLVNSIKQLVSGLDPVDHPHSTGLPIDTDNQGQGSRPALL